MSILGPADKLRKTYTLLLEREKKAEKFLNNCSKDDFARWNGEYKKLLKQLEDLLMSIRNYTPENILEGWPETLKPDFQSIKPKEKKKEELKTKKLF